MKKLTLILSTILLMSSTAAFAKSKTANLNVDMGSLSNCLHAEKGLEDIAQDEKNINFMGKCEGQKLVGKLKLSYRVRSSEKFRLDYGRHGRIGTRKDAKTISNALGMIFEDGVSITTEYDEKIVHRYAHYWIKGKISLR